MRGAALLSLLVLAACGSSSAQVAGATSPSPPASAYASPSPSPPPSPSAIASPTATATAYPTTFALPPISPAPIAPAGQCFLPVTFFTDPGNSPTFSAGFLQYPSGVLQAANTITLKAPSSPFYFLGATYDRSVARWLPVPQDAISPDGLTFAYADYDLPPSPTAGMAGEQLPHAAGALATTGRVHVVDASSGADRILFAGSPTYELVGFTAAGIYLAEVTLTMDGQFLNGLYLLNPAGGTPQPVPGGTHALDRFGWEVVGGAAWGTDYSTGGGIQAGNQLVRLDLKTGAVQEWLTRPEGVGVGLIGLDSQGEPLVVLYGSGYSSTGSPSPVVPTEVWILSGPDAGKSVYQNSDATASFPSGPAYADNHGVWLDGNGPGAVFHYDPQAGFRSVPVPVAAGVRVGGTCV
jgi:hypothetical protein